MTLSDSWDTPPSNSNYSLTGIKESCVWNDVHNFHISSNLFVDIMHDVLEDVCNYTLSAVLNHLIFNQHLFSIETLNSRIRTFNYGFTEKSTIPPLIKVKDIQNRIRMSASEMGCFCRYLGLMVGDLIPRSNNCWKLYLLLRRMIDIITAPTVRHEQGAILHQLIQKHHAMYMKISGEQLKPKFHHMLHYKRAMELVGPLVHAIRIETQVIEINQ